MTSKKKKKQKYDEFSAYGAFYLAEVMHEQWFEHIVESPVVTGDGKIMGLAIEAHCAMYNFYDALAGYLGGVSDATINTWRKKGIIPDVLEWVAKFDRFAVDAALNKKSGLSHEEGLSEYDQWKNSRANKSKGIEKSN